MTQGDPNPKADVGIEHSSVVCFAMEQSGVPIVNRAVIRNTGTVRLPPTVLRLSVEPALSSEAVRLVRSLQPGEEHDAGVVDVPLEPGHLRKLLEAERAQLVWKLSAGESVVAEGRSPLQILAHNEWPGLRAPPGLLATFATPNHPAVGSVLKHVGDRLRTATGTDAIDGYQSNSPARAYAMVQSLYDCVQALGLSYAGLPASFEEQGQKLRLPDLLLRDRVGNCLDLTLFVVACLEQMGLAPIIVLFKSHAIPAVWLVDDRFPEGIVSDAARIRTAISLGYIVAFDSSTIVDVKRPSLENARSVADRLLEKDADFESALDVRVLRRNGFRPLSLREGGDVATPVSPSPIARRPILPIDSPKMPVGDANDIRDRFRMWRDQLLDVSLRNKLLNFRMDAKGCLPLSVPDISRFEDLLAADTAFDVLPSPPRDSRDARDPQLQETRVDPAQKAVELLEDLKKGTVHCPLQPSEMLKRAVHLERTARVDLEEGGANTLYVAIGFLRWYESKEEDSLRIAPLLVVPVQIEYARTTQRVRIRHLHEDSLPNYTLIEKLRGQVDLSGLENIQPDDSGLDVPAMLRSVREAIRHMPRWEVDERAALGLFTFRKFLMWRDLTTNRDSLLTNPLVRYLASNGSTELPSRPEVEPCDLDRLPSEALPLVVDSDSSQMAAVASALSGRSFILQGPPGTGKSQTITNFISAALHAGKTVLFVSEKMAALDVVHRRLTHVGLGDFCLELHSHKAQKRAVIDSFRRALERKRSTDSVPWTARSLELDGLRGNLNQYVDALHRARPIGLTFFAATARLLELKDAPSIRLSIADAINTSETQHRERMELSAHFATCLAPVAPPTRHPWKSSRLRTWSSSLEESLGDALREAEERRQAAAHAATTLCELLETPLTQCSIGKLRNLAQIVETLGKTPMPKACLDRDAWTALASRSDAWQRGAKKIDGSRTKILTRWQDTLFEIDLEPLDPLFQRWAYAFFLFAWFFLLGARSRLRELARAQLPSNGQIAEDLKLARAVLAETERLDGERSELVSLFEGTWDGDAGTIEQLLTRGNRVRENMERLGTSSVPNAALKLLDAKTSNDERKRASKIASGFVDALQAMETATRHALEQLRIPPGELPPDDPNFFDGLGSLLGRYATSLPKLRSWCLYAQSVEDVRRVGLGPIVDAVEAERLSSVNIELAAERSLLENWVKLVRDGEPALRDFDGPNRHRLVDRFRAQDRAHLELGRREVARGLEQRLPVMTNRVSEKSELGIINREIGKKTRHTAIRQLFQQIPNALPRLKPCLLMSPLSVAQYLPATSKRFDLVVFDEASQICTHDAIGAIARGEQLIVVGDSKQLPPSNFFKRGADEDSQNENDFDELESVLDEAKAVGFPEQMLTWHYRSRHETLIGFSNDHYYDSRLNVFPAAASRVAHLGVHWHHVRNGVYERNRTRTNPVEARAAVDFLVRRLIETEPGRRSFGVVTFSQAQQDLVEDLLDQARGSNPKVEAHFSDRLIEPVFVKNLENVQGDERDEIVFSIGYGPDETGRVSMNFGPLNRKGGERRLNVAITRARQALRVFSALTPDHIDLRRTDTVGPRHLKAFLLYVARNGALQGSESCVATYPSAFEAEVARHLVAAGRKVDTDVGAGVYKLNLGVAHPDRAGVYALGVELDGDAYATAVTARDRDRLRHDLLTGLGWRLHRIWSTDWWFDRQREQTRLDEAITNAVSQPTDQQFEPQELDVSLEATALPADPIGSPLEPVEAVSEAPSSPMRAYAKASLRAQAVDPETLFNDSYKQAIRAAIETVLAVEAPLHVDDLCRRVGTAFGASRISARMKTRILLLASACAEVRGEFARQRGAQAYDGMRGPCADGETRHADRIPPEEVANVARWLLSENISLPADELVREMARAFGLQRAGTTVMESMQLGLTHLMKRGECAIADGIVTPTMATPVAQPVLPTVPDEKRPHPLADSLARSPLFREHCKATARDRLLQVIDLLAARDGHCAPFSVVATSLQVQSTRISGLIATLSQELNQDGFIVLHPENATQQVSLDVEKLRQLYGL